MRSTAVLLLVGLVLLAPARVQASDGEAPSVLREPVSLGVATALGTIGTVVPLVAGGLTFIGLQTGGDAMSLVSSGIAIMAFGLALGPGLAHGYIGRRGYAAASTIVRMGLAVGLCVSTQLLFVAMIAAPIVGSGLLAWAIVDLALVPRMVEAANEARVSLVPWTDARGGTGLAVLGRF
ncbi:MAG: hypothetical protein JRG91_04270 [Deltaproteobacteria bacterium]|nr:hypothetical protein [Deltaproteobacteria bacterium]